jgi:hypothetical protein
MIHAGRRQAETMTGWIPFEGGRYLAQRAVLLTVDGRAVELEDTVIEVSEGPGGKRRLSGRGRAPNALMVELLEEGQEPDLLIDLGGEFKYRMRNPRIQGGKVFARGVKSFVQFVPQSPWEQVPEADFNFLMARIRILPAGGS